MNFVRTSCNAESTTKLTAGLAESSLGAELMDKRLFDVQELSDGQEEKA